MNINLKFLSAFDFRLQTPDCKNYDLRNNHRHGIVRPGKSAD